MGTIALGHVVLVLGIERMGRGLDGLDAWVADRTKRQTRLAMLWVKCIVRGRDGVVLGRDRRPPRRRLLVVAQEIALGGIDAKIAICLVVQVMQPIQVNPSDVGQLDIYLTLTLHER